MSEDTVVIGNVISNVIGNKAELSPEEIYNRAVVKMSPRQMASHLRRQARKRSDNLLHGAWATVLSTIFQSSELANPGKGELAPYLR
jgi:hypothetical protein